VELERGALMNDPGLDTGIPPGRASVVVIGGGISGLALAYWLRKAGTNVTVLEASDGPGGTMKTTRDGDWLVETGPNSALDTTPLFGELFQELGIAAQVLYAGEGSNNRYILRGGKLHPLPMGPGAFLSSRLWSWPGKLRLLKEPFIGKARHEESIAAFVERRLGREFLDYAINPFVAGGDARGPRTLSVREAFPKLHALEAKYGGILKGAVLSSRERKKRAETAKNTAKMFSFRDGMETFPRALAASLGSAFQPGCTVESVIPMRVGARPIHTVTYQQRGVRMQREANVVVYAVPTHAAAPIIRPIDPGMASTLSSVYYPPVAEVFVGFPLAQIGRALDGFGFLVPEKEHRKILGCIWSSSLFPGRAPSGHAALTTFVGGSRSPELAALPEAELRLAVLSELRELLGATGEPSIVRIVRWERAIPQYTLGYRSVLDAMDRFELNFQGSFFCSNARGGIAVGDCVMSAHKTAGRIGAYLAFSPGSGSRTE
jgi:oxygen-dependent protoporphyrinogen oxidase